jgi:hypothetical protein
VLAWAQNGEAFGPEWFASLTPEQQALYQANFAITYGGTDSTSQPNLGPYEYREYDPADPNRTGGFFPPAGADPRDPEIQGNNFDF